MEDQVKILKSDWDAWVSNPITQKFMQAVNQKREETKENIANAAYPSYEELTHNIGYCIALASVLEGRPLVNLVDDDTEETE